MAKEAGWAAPVSPLHCAALPKAAAWPSARRQPLPLPTPSLNNVLPLLSSPPFRLPRQQDLPVLPSPQKPSLTPRRVQTVHFQRSILLTLSHSFTEEIVVQSLPCGKHHAWGWGHAEAQNMLPPLQWQWRRQVQTSIRIVRNLMGASRVMGGGGRGSGRGPSGARWQACLRSGERKQVLGDEVPGAEVLVSGEGRLHGTAEAICKEPDIYSTAREATGGLQVRESR